MVLFGPPAVGKMTVGRAVCERTDFRLFLNHHTIEPLAEIFGMDSRPFRTLTGEFRRRVVEEAAAANVALMLTLVRTTPKDPRWRTATLGRSPTERPRYHRGVVRFRSSKLPRPRL